MNPAQYALHLAQLNNKQLNPNASLYIPSQSTSGHGRTTLPHNASGSHNSQQQQQQQQQAMMMNPLLMQQMLLSPQLLLSTQQQQQTMSLHAAQQAAQMGGLVINPHNQLTPQQTQQLLYLQSQQQQHQQQQQQQQQQHQLHQQQQQQQQHHMQQHAALSTVGHPSLAHLSLTNSPAQQNGAFRINRNRKSSIGSPTTLTAPPANNNPAAAYFSNPMMAASMPLALDGNAPLGKQPKKKRGRRERERLKRRLAREAEAAALASGQMLPQQQQGGQELDEGDDDSGEEGQEGQQSPIVEPIKIPTPQPLVATSPRVLQPPINYSAMTTRLSPTSHHTSNVAPIAAAAHGRFHQSTSPAITNSPAARSASLFPASTAPTIVDYDHKHHSSALSPRRGEPDAPHAQIKDTSSLSRSGGVISAATLLSELTLRASESANSTASAPTIGETGESPERGEGEKRSVEGEKGEGELVRRLSRGRRERMDERRARSSSPSMSLSSTSSTSMSYPEVDMADPVSTISQPSLSFSSSVSSSAASSSSLSSTSPSLSSRRHRSKSIDRSVSGYLTQSPSSTPSVSRSSISHSIHSTHRRHASSGSSPTRKMDLANLKALSAQVAANNATTASSSTSSTSSSTTSSSSSPTAGSIPSTSITTVPLQSADTRKQLIAYISSAQCKLFSTVSGYFQVSHDHLDQLIHAGRGLPNLLLRLGKLDAKAKKFTSMPALIAAVEAAETKSLSKKRKLLLGWFASSECQLFSRMDSVKVTVDELDELMDVCASASSSASSSASLRALLRLLKSMNERGQRFDSVRAVIPVLQVMHEKDEQTKRHDELAKQLAAQQQQLLLLQQQLMQQQVMQPLASPTYIPSSSPPPSANAPSALPNAFDSMPGNSYVESFLQQMQQQQQLLAMQQHYAHAHSPLAVSPPPSSSPLYDYYGNSHLAVLGGEPNDAFTMQQQLGLMSINNSLYSLHQHQQQQMEGGASGQQPNQSPSHSSLGHHQPPHGF